MMFFIRLFIVMIVVLMGCLPASAIQKWSADNVPVPYLKDSTQYISDPEGILPKNARDSANFYLQKLNLECGVQNVFVIVGHVVNQDAFRMAQDIGNKYGIGHKKSRRGLVVVVAVADHKYFIAPGMGLEGELTDVDCDDIARACIVKNMRVDRPDLAVVEASRAIYNKVKNGRTGVSDIDEGPVGANDWFLIAIVLLLCFGVPLYYIIRYVLEQHGVVKKHSTHSHHPGRKRQDDDWLPPFFLGGGGGFSSEESSFSGGSFGGGSFGGGGSGGEW